MNTDNAARVLCLVGAMFGIGGAATAVHGARDLLVSGRFNSAVTRHDGDTGDFVEVFADGGGLQNAIGMQFGPDGNLYVGLGDDAVVLRYCGRTGDFVDAFVRDAPETPEDETGGLACVRGLVFGPDENLYVSGGCSDQVHAYDGQTGAFLHVAASGGGLDGPIGVAFDSEGRLYVAGGLSNGVHRYDGATGDYLDDFVAPGAGGLVNASGLLFGPDGHLYVASGVGDRVARYDGATGVYIDDFVSRGAGGLDSAIGIAFGPDGHFYVASFLTDSVIRYDGETGDFMDVFVSPGDGGLDGTHFLAFLPCPLDVDGDGEIGPQDVALILAAWGVCEDDCPEDTDRNGFVGFGDILTVLAAWGPCTSGACCLPDATCFVDSDDVCAAAGGRYQGSGTDCETTCRGACCLPDGTCVENTIENECLAGGGIFGGNGGTCERDCRTGACCFADSCIIVIEPFCTAMGGRARREGSTCENECDFSADDCADAVIVGDGSHRFSTIGSSEEGPDLPPTCDEGAGLSFLRDVWFRYQAPIDGTATASVCESSFNNRMAIYDDGDCPGAFIACSDDACGSANTRAETTFPVSAGAVYLVRIGSRTTGSVGTGTLEITSVP